MLLLAVLNVPLRFLALNKTHIEAKRAIGHYSFLLTILVCGIGASALCIYGEFFILLSLLLFKSITVLTLPYKLIYQGSRNFAIGLITFSLIYTSSVVAFSGYLHSIADYAVLLMGVSLPFIAVFLKKELTLNHFQIQPKWIAQSLIISIAPALSLATRRIELIYVGLALSMSLAAEYAVAISIPAVVGQLFIPMGGVLIQKFQSTNSSINRPIQSLLALFPAIALFFWFLLRNYVTYLDFFIAWVFGSDYDKLGQIVLWSMTLTCIWIVTNIMGQFSLAKARTNDEIRALTFSLVVLVVLIFFCRPQSLSAILSIKTVAYCIRYYHQFYSISRLEHA